MNPRRSKQHAWSRIFDRNCFMSNTIPRNNWNRADYQSCYKELPQQKWVSVVAETTIVTYSCSMSGLKFLFGPVRKPIRVIRSRPWVRQTGTRQLNHVQTTCLLRY